MLGVRSCSPLLMKHFWPDTRHEPVASCMATVFTRPRSLPACGSVRHIVPLHWPLARCGANIDSTSALANRARQASTPSRTLAKMEKARLAAARFSVARAPRARGKPWPPRLAGTVSEGQPAAT